jgi:threonine/homoserine/homoserine lactone efflux protein
MQAAILEGIGMGLLLSLMVGPVFFMLITSSMEQGFRYAAVLALGILISDLVYVLITYFGVSFLTQYPLIQQVLGYVGGCILIGFGISFWRKKVIDRPNSGGLIVEKAKKRTAFAKGFGVNGVNPFVMLFWISIASLVSSKNNWDAGDRLFYYFGLLLTVFGIDLGKAFVAGKLAHLMTPRLRGFLNKGVGTLICYFGVKMIWDTMGLL